MTGAIAEGAERERVARDEQPAAVPIMGADAPRKTAPRKTAPRKTAKPRGTRQAEQPKRYRGFYKLPDGTRLMSVTTIINGGVPKPALVHWAASEAAKAALEAVPMLVRARTSDQKRQAYDHIRKAAEHKRDAAATVGGLVHDRIEHQILGTPAVPLDQLDPELRPFLDAYVQFEQDWRPVWLAAEMVVANTTDGWAGQLDGICTFPYTRPDLGAVLLDWKTGKGIYGEVGLQLSAYRRGELAWLKSGESVPMPPTDTALVIHIRPAHLDGGEPKGYAVQQVDVSDEVYATFLAAKAIATDWGRDLANRVVSAPLDPWVGHPEDEPTAAPTPLPGLPPAENLPVGTEHAGLVPDPDDEPPESDGARASTALPPSVGAHARRITELARRAGLPDDWRADAGLTDDQGS